MSGIDRAESSWHILAALSKRLGALSFSGENSIEISVLLVHMVLSIPVESGDLV